MEIRSVGNSGLQVSRIGLGTMTWGRDTDEHEAAELLDAFLSAGGTLVDTADVYADGESEKILGRLAGRQRPPGRRRAGHQSGLPAGP
ncbi:MAG: aldo/keto reductase [Candidatus Nanopelagicales bacterium]